MTRRIPGPERKEEQETLRVAFVVAALNAEATLDSAVGSALGQTIREVEVVVVDDGSTDGTAERAATLADRDPRVKVETQPNRGPGAARNRGVGRSRAPYLCFLDDDDLVPPDKARIQADYLDRNPDVSVVYSRTRLFGPEGTERECPVTEDGGALAAEILSGADRGFPCHAAVVRRSAFLAVGGFRERRPLVEDLDLWVRLAAAGHRFAFLPEPAVLYRERRGSRSTRVLEVTEGRLETLAWLYRNLPRRPRDRRGAVRMKARYRCLALAGKYAELGRKGRSRRLVLRSLRWARSAGEVAESLAGLIAPTRFVAYAGTRESPGHDR